MSRRRGDLRQACNALPRCKSGDRFMPGSTVAPTPKTTRDGACPCAGHRVPRRNYIVKRLIALLALAAALVLAWLTAVTYRSSTGLRAP